MRYCFGQLLADLILIAMCWSLACAESPATASASPPPRQVEPSLAQLQLSDVYWGNVQVGEIRWGRQVGESNANSSTATAALNDAADPNRASSTTAKEGGLLRWWALLDQVQITDSQANAPSLNLGGLQLDCDLASDTAIWACEQGRWAWHSPQGQTYQGQWWARPQLQGTKQAWLELRADGLQLQLKGSLEAPQWALELATQDMAQWLSWWPASLPLQAAVLKGALKLSASGGLDQAKLKLNLSGVDFDSVDGLIASAGLDLALNSEIAWHDEFWQVQSTGSIGPGALLWNDLYLDLSDRQASFALNLGARPSEDEWFIEHLAWRDPPALTLAGHGRWQNQSLQALKVEELALDLARLNSAYLSGWLARAALTDLQLQGQLTGALSWLGQALEGFQFELKDVAVADGRQRFAIEGLSGKLQLAAELDASGAFNHVPVAQTAQGVSGDGSSISQLHWEGLSIWGLDSGPSQLQGRLRPRSFELSASTRLPLLDGALRMDQFRAERDPDGNWELRLGAELEPISMAQLTTAFGWPAFGGRVAGRLPGATYENGVLSLDGSLGFEIFSGQVALNNLALERTFGTLPSLSADLSIQGLDLEALTQAFSFGRITGLLDGEVRGLRLLNWRPVAFDAWIASSGKGGRISQRAVDNLSRIGGGGGAALGGIVGALFEEFPYRRLGLSCRLNNNICHMGGVDGAAGNAPLVDAQGRLQGYDIVVGRGLPRISIKGFQRQVDWPRLVAQLQQIIAGPGTPELH